MSTSTTTGSRRRSARDDQQDDNDDVWSEEEVEEENRDKVGETSTQPLLDTRMLHKVMRDTAKIFKQRIQLQKRSVDTLDVVLQEFLRVVMEHSTSSSSSNKDKTSNVMTVEDIHRAMIELNLEFLLPRVGLSVHQSTEEDASHVINPMFYED
ncbi:hypothetical protein SAMD00019534_090790 [Acytostelium subglobosum LB1]|uniref:hypothetical protein n=1 Tax=Acytostelium subglobosum LB1 TaxID=1410327 RepID=UPI000644EC85|nr:hypothetical protein SAMD00019534_090790 [Acytostelium subglobosum LB1]GAM25904.1 hypothetical protein SAMD00019534_090790 [Acytostelium subglobosum LB1]|eukprot:XP_012750947.1 hypothetical protein SAMD00019534_090790 [Acytostelium subglobosum LB1]